MEKAGYRVATDMTVKTLTVEGMTCASCSAAVERVTRKLDGVAESKVNLATEKLTISYDPSKLRLSDIKSAIEKAGYRAKEEEGVDLDKEKKEKEIKGLWRRFITSAIFTLPLLYIAMGHMVGLPLPGVLHPDMNPAAFALVQLILTLPPVIVGHRFYTVGFRTLIKGNPNMDSLIAIGTSAAFIYGVFATIMILRGDGTYAHELYFESAAVILTLITLGKYMEAVSKGKTSEAIKKLMGLTPKTAVILKDGREVELPIEEVEVGDIILVKPGERMPVDGEVVEGTTSVDDPCSPGRASL